MHHCRRPLLPPLLLCCHSQPEDCHCWRGAISKHMDSHVVVYHILAEIVVFIPEKAMEISVIFTNNKILKHVFYVGCYDNQFLSKPEEHTQKGVIQVGPVKQHVIERHSIKLHTRVKHCSNLPRLLWVVDTKSWKVPFLLILIARRCKLCMFVINYFLHEFHKVGSHVFLLVKCTTKKT